MYTFLHCPHFSRLSQPVIQSLRRYDLWAWATYTDTQKVAGARRQRVRRRSATVALRGAAPLSRGSSADQREVSAHFSQKILLLKTNIVGVPILKIKIPFQESTGSPDHTHMHTLHRLNPIPLPVSPNNLNLDFPGCDQIGRLETVINLRLDVRF